MKALVLGASINPVRFSNIAVKSLLRHHWEVIAFGNKEGKINEVEIQTNWENFEGVHTIMLYLSAKNQKHFYEKLLSLNPKRIIFNPGTENPEFEKLAIKNQIEVRVECGLVMINNNIF